MSAASRNDLSAFISAAGSRLKDLILRRDSRRLVFCAFGCGLANRLRALVGYQALAHFRQLPLELAWMADNPCPCEFRDLFDSPIRLIGRQALRSISPQAIYREPLWFETIWERWGTGIERNRFFREVHGCIRQLAPRQEIAETVAQFQLRHDLSAAIGIHIRNTDNLAAHAGYVRNPNFEVGRVSSIAGFAAFIAAKIPTSPVFLATDDAALETSLKQQFPALITFPKTHDLTKLRTAPMETALAEMLLLGRCRIVVGTYYSSFGEFSAVWGRVPYFVMEGHQPARSRFVDRLMAASE